MVNAISTDPDKTRRRRYRGPRPEDRSVRPVHTRIPGRARFKVFPLYRCDEVKRQLESGLRRVDGVLDAQANVLTGSLLVTFDPRISVEDMVRRITAELETPLPPPRAKQEQGPSACGPPRGLPITGEPAYLSADALHFTALPAALLGSSPLVTMPLAFLRAFSAGLFHTSPILILLASLIVLMGQIIGKKEGWSRTDALYFAFITASTVGYGDLRPTTRSTKLLSVAIGLVGLLLTGMITAVGVHAIQRALQRIP